MNNFMRTTLFGTAIAVFSVSAVLAATSVPTVATEEVTTGNIFGSILHTFDSHSRAGLIFQNATLTPATY